MKTFKVVHLTYNGDDPIEVAGYDHESAAEAYAEKYDTNGDYSLSGGSEELITVEDGEGVLKNFRVSALLDVIYRAREIK